MTTPPTPPSPGKPISASFFARQIAWVKSGMLVEGTGYRLRRGPNGTALDIDVANLRRVSSKKIPGRFEITFTKYEMTEGSEPEDQTYTATFMNPYYDIGGKTYEMPADESLDTPSVKISGIKEGDIIAIKVTATGAVPSATLESYQNIADLKSAQSDYNYFVRPLYKVGSGGSIECDFRTGPTLDMGESA